MSLIAFGKMKLGGICMGSAGSAFRCVVITDCYNFVFDTTGKVLTKDFCKNCPNYREPKKCDGKLDPLILMRLIRDYEHLLKY